MKVVEFMKLKERFIEADVDGKIDIYVSTENLTQDQYRDLLREFPLDKLNKLEMALR